MAPSFRCKEERGDPEIAGSLSVLGTLSKDELLELSPSSSLDDVHCIGKDALTFNNLPSGTAGGSILPLLFLILEFDCCGRVLLVMSIPKERPRPNSPEINIVSVVLFDRNGGLTWVGAGSCRLYFSEKAGGAAESMLDDPVDLVPKVMEGVGEK